MGNVLDSPTRVLCDAEAALRPASGETSVARLKHALRRSAIVNQRVRSGEVELCHLPDAGNWTDVFTKWVKRDKFDRCMAYLRGALARAAFAGDEAIADAPSILLAFESLAGAIERRNSRRAAVLAALVG